MTEKLEALRIFISSPGDVVEERTLTKRVLERLQGEFAGRATLQAIFWEHEPLLATDSFQGQIVRPSETDIMVTILWSRLGTRLPSQFTRDDGSRYSSGTEFEFEDAVTAYRREGRPDLLVYRKTADPVVSLKDKKTLLEKLNQKEALDAFFDKWFHDKSQGTLIAAFHPFDNSADFEELLELHLKKLIERRVPKEASGEEIKARPIQWQKGSPYRGLHVFNFEHAPIFFGRTKAVGDVLNALRIQSSDGRAFVLVLGMSGGGKSSLIHAGVLPVLTQPGVIEGVGLWRRAIMRPGDSSGDMFDAMAAALLRKEALSELAQDNICADELAQLLRETPKATLPLLKSGLSRAASEFAKKEQLKAKPSVKMVLVVDQMEEMFTLGRVTDEERVSFIEALDALARSGWIWVIATLRSDFYPRCTELETLIALKEGAGQYDLLPPTPAEIGQMIRQPAQAAGLHFEEDPATKERLDETLRDAASKDPGSLALLEFTLEELYKNRTEQGLLTQEAYKSLGGVEGALARRAEEVFDGLAANVQSAFGPVFHELVSIGLGEEDIITRKFALFDLISSDPRNKRFVEVFIEARLFISDLDDKGQAVVSVAHEALLQHWPRLRNWVEKNKENLRAHARVSAAASRWMEEGKSKDFLLAAGKPLAEAEELDKSPNVDLPEQERSFIAASIAKKRRLRWLKRSVVVGLALSTAIAVSMAYLANKQRQRAQIEAKTSNQVSEFLVNLFEVSDPSEALGNTITAREILDKGADNVEEELKEQPEIQATLLSTIGNVYRNLGLYEQALPLFEKALFIRKQLFGDENLEVCSSKKDLANLLIDRAEFESVESLLLEALEVQRRLLGEEDPAVGETLSSLAVFLYEQGDYSGAKAVNQEALAMRRKLLGDDHPDVATSMNNLGLTLYKKAEFAEAELLHREALAIRRKIYGNEHLEVANSLNNLALVLSDKGEYEEVESSYKEVLAIRRKIYGHEHPRIATSLINLAYHYWDMADWGSAEALFREALAMRRKLLGDDHPDVASACSNLAGVLTDKGDYEEAELLHRESLAIHRKISGNEHPEVGRALNELGRMLITKKDYERAAPLLRESLAIFRKVYGNEHPEVSTALNNLAAVLTGKNDYEGAEPLLRESLAIRRKQLGDNHPRVANSLNNLASLLSRMSNYREAETMLRECIEIYKKTLPKDHWLIFHSTASLGKCFFKLKRFEEAEKLLLECCENLESKSEPNITEITKTLGYIVDLYTEWGKPEKAAEYRTKLQGLSE